VARVVTGPLAPPSATSGLFEVFRRRYLLRLLVKRELSARYQASVLGLVWSYIQPLTRFLMYYFVIGGIMGLHDNVQEFGIHVFTGLVFVHYFTETFTAGTRSIVRNRSLVQKMAMPREMFPVASMFVSAYHTIPQLIILTIAALTVGWRPDGMGVVAGVLAFAITMVFGTALALFFSALNVIVRDFQNVVGTLTTFIHFGVPMIYTFEMVADRFGREYVWIYLLNPVADAVLLAQRCFWVYSTDDPNDILANGMPDHLFERGLIVLAASFVLLGIAQWVFSRLENSFPERL
jgi:ABC-2 type transport system permease protein